MKRYLFTSIILVSAIVIFSGCGKKETAVPAQENSFILHLTLGDVKVANEKGTAPGIAGQALSLNDIVTTGKGAIADILYGTQGVIRVNENTTVKIAGIADKADDKTTLEMDKGKVFCTLSKLKKSEFRVKTPTAIAGVRGTSFSVSSGAKGAKFMVASGVVKVNPVQEGKIIETVSTEVTKGQKTELIDVKTAKELTSGKKEFKAVETTVEEKKEIQGDAKGINLELIKNLDISVKKEIQEDVIAEPAVKDKEKPKDDRSGDIRKQRDAELKAQREDEMRKEAELKREEELRREREAQAKVEQVKKEEKKKKDRASNIPSI